MSEESGITLHFYKNKAGTPRILFKWGESADTLLRGNGFSNIQTRIIVEGLLSNTRAPKYAKVTLIELIKQLNYGIKSSDSILNKVTKKRSSDQQYYRVLKKIKATQNKE